MVGETEIREVNLCENLEVQIPRDQEIYHGPTWRILEVISMTWRTAGRRRELTATGRRGRPLRAGALCSRLETIQWQNVSKAVCVVRETI